MSETCKICHEKFNSGIWMSPQFKNEVVLLFCSDKCKNKYIQMKLERIKVKYPKYYCRLMRHGKKRALKNIFPNFLKDFEINNRNEFLGKKKKNSVVVSKRLVR